MAERASKPAAGTGDVCLTELEVPGQLALRGDPAERRFAARAAGVLQLELPIEANTVIANNERRVIWMGPREWLIVTEAEPVTRLQAELVDALGNEHTAVVDVSHAREIFGLRGPKARRVLMKGCAIDLHPREFGPGQCVQTRLARCHMLLHQLDDAPSYHIYVHRSFARYAWTWLRDAGQEFGMLASTV